MKYRDELVPLLSEYFLTKTAKHWVDTIHAVKVPVGVINSVADALDEPQIQHRGMVVNIPHAYNKKFKVIGSPMKLSDTPVEYRHAPPQLGEHTTQILSRYRNAHELEALRAKGIIDMHVA